MTKNLVYPSMILILSIASLNCIPIRSNITKKKSHHCCTPTFEISQKAKARYVVDI